LRRSIYIALAIVALAAGVVASSAFADPPGPPSNPPGSPGDNCSHGNSDKPCKPDPQPEHGQDCDDHGRARGNEDHCGPGETTTSTTTETTPTTTTTPTTSTVPTGTTPTTPATETAPETTPTPSTETGPPSGGESNPPVTETTPTTVPTEVPGTEQAKAAQKERRQLERDLRKQAAKAARGPHGREHTARTGELPFTGLPLGAWAVLGSLLVGGGLALRRHAVNSP
jgi:hypothetical protein